MTVSDDVLTNPELQHISPGLRHLAIPIDDIAPDDNNAMAHDEANIAEIARSLDRFGQRKPLVGNHRTGQTEAGAGTWLAAKRLDWQWIAVSWEDDDPEIAAQFGVADNATPSDAWNMERLQAIWESSGGDVPGLDEARLKELWQASGQANGKEPKDPKPQIDRAGELQEVWGTALGQIWEIGQHRLVIGDCTDKEVVNAVAFGESIDWWYGDPPYSVGYADKNKSLNAVAKGNSIQTPIENDHMATEETAGKIWKPAFSNLFAICKQGCAYYCSAPQGGDQMMMMMSLCESGWLVKHEIIWVKNNHVLGRADYQYKHEPIIYGWKPGAAHYFTESRSEVSTWEIDKPHNSDLHPTEKPLELVMRAMRNSSRPNDICADFFVGSGTTMVSAENMGRRARCIEISPAYAAVTIQRMADLGIEPVLL